MSEKREDANSGGFFDHTGLSSRRRIPISRRVLVEAVAITGAALVTRGLSAQTFGAESWRQH